MGNDLFGVDIAGIIADAMGGQLLDVTVTRQVRPDRAPGDKLTKAPPAVPTSVTGISGFWEDYTGTPPAGVLLELGDRKAVLIGDTIPAGGAPVRGDLVTIEGQTLAVVKLQSRDPAAAVYTYQCRDRGKLDA